MGWRTETAEWRAAEQTARWTQTTEWRSASGTHGWRSTTEAWQTGSGAEGFIPPGDPATRQQPAISGTAWPTAGDSINDSGRTDGDRPGREQFTAPPAPRAAEPPAWASPVEPQRPGWQTPNTIDGRHLVREDDRAQWRESVAGASAAEDTTRAGRRRAAEGRTTGSGTGWATRSDADNWAGHTDTGSLPLYETPPSTWGASSGAGTWAGTGDVTGGWPAPAESPSWPTSGPDRTGRATSEPGWATSEPGWATSEPGWGTSESERPSWARSEPTRPSWTTPEPERPSRTTPEPERPSWTPPEPTRPTWATPEAERANWTTPGPERPSWATSEPEQPRRPTPGSTTPARPSWERPPETPSTAAWSSPPADTGRRRDDDRPNWARSEPQTWSSTPEPGGTGEIGRRRIDRSGTGGATGPGDPRRPYDDEDDRPGWARREPDTGSRRPVDDTAGWQRNDDTAGWQRNDDTAGWASSAPAGNAPSRRRDPDRRPPELEAGPATGGRRRAPEPPRETGSDQDRLRPAGDRRRGGDPADWRERADWRVEPDSGVLDGGEDDDDWRRDPDTGAWERTRERLVRPPGDPEAPSNGPGTPPGSTGTRLGTTGTRPDTTATRLGPTGTRPDTTATRLGTTGTRPDTTATRLGTTGTRPDTTATRLGTTGTRPDTTGARLGTTGTRPDTTGTRLGTTGTTPGTTGTRLGRPGNPGPGADGDSSRTGRRGGALPPPADPWSGSAAVNGRDPYPVPPADTGSWRTAADGPRPGGGRRRAEDRPASGDRTAPEDDDRGVGSDPANAAATMPRPAPAGPVDPELFRRDGAPSRLGTNWPDPRDPEDWRRELREQASQEYPDFSDAPTEIRQRINPDTLRRDAGGEPFGGPAAWQLEERERHDRGTAPYRDGGTGDWRRDLATSADLADGESRRFSTEEFSPFRPTGSARVTPPPASSANIPTSPPVSARPPIPTSPPPAGPRSAGPRPVSPPVGRPREEALVGAERPAGTRWQDPPDTEWPPRGVTGSFRTGSYERRASGSLDVSPSRSSNLLDPDEDELEESTGGPLAAVGYTVIWYGVPVVLFVLYMLLNGSQRAHALSTLAHAAPQFGVSLVLSMIVAVGLRWASGSWKSASVGLAAAVMGGGLATVLSSAITGNALT